MVHGEEAKSKFQVLIDSDAFVGWLYIDDPHHLSAKKIFENIRRQRLRVATTSWVVMETATVLSYRKGQVLAVAFLKQLKRIGLPSVHIDEELQEDAISIFQNQRKKGTSMVDCGNVAVMNRFKIPRIFSFDKFYSKQFGIAASE